VFSGFPSWITTSSILHMVAFITIGILSRERFHPPEELEIISVQLMSMPAPPARQAAPTPPQPEPKEAVIPNPVEKPPPKPKPEKPQEAKPVVKEPEPQQEATERLGQVDAKPSPAVSDRPSTGSDLPVQVEFEGPPFEYAYYIIAIREKIAASWEVPEAMDGLVARVRFRIERNGKVVEAEILETSGNPIFDNSALRALLKASPLPPLPAKYPQDWLGVRLQFVYQQ
jgi:TonB family protein